MKRLFFDLTARVVDFVGSDSRLLIKAKSSLDKKIISAWLQDNIDSKRRQNVYVSSKIPLYDAFAWSSLLVGYNSLSTMEALLTRVPLIMPKYLAGSENEKIITDAQCAECGVELIESESDFAYKVEELMPKILSGVNDEELRARQKVFSNYWMWSKDVTACERFSTVLDSLIDRTVHFE